MIAVDVGWWRLGFSLTKRRLWRVLISLFMGVQLLALVSAIAGFDWPNHVPKVVLLTIMVWHYFALGVLVPLGGVWGVVWAVRRLRRRREARRSDCDSGPTPPSAAADATLVSRRDFVGAAIALAPPLCTLGAGSLALARLDNLRVRQFTVSLPTLPRALDGLTIAHLTDTHVSRLMTGAALQQAVEKTKALQADMVVFTGDLIDYSLDYLDEGIAALKAVETPYGLWMVEGNHDLAEDEGEFERRVRAAGLQLLKDESALVNVRGCPVQFFGLRWMLARSRTLGGRFDRLVGTQVRMVLQQRQPQAFPILLTHHPHAFDAAAAAGLPLTLAGHTHGGQFMLNEKFGLGSVLFRYWTGLYKRSSSQMIVSNGVGTWLPLRINAPAEIVHLTLRRS